MRLRLALLGLVAALAVTASAAAGPAAPVLVSAAPALPAGAVAAGSLPASTTVSGTVVLKPRNNAALQSFILAVSNPRSPLFHQYLPAGAFAGRFGPSPATIAAVRANLQGSGLTVTGVASDGLLVNFRGTAARVAHAFDTAFARYRLADGTMARATTAPIRLSPSIAGAVSAVLGLSDTVHERPLGLARPHRTAARAARAASSATSFPHPAGSPTPCTAATAAARSFGGLTDDQIADSYGAFGLYGAGDFGAGQRIALYELEPFLRSDIQVFDTCYFGAARAAAMLARLHVIRVDGGQPAGTGSGEALLDVEDLSALAPGAEIDVYEAPSYGTDGIDYDPIDNYVAMIDADRNQVISTSWGLCEQSIQAGQPGLQEAENELFEQAAAQGQSIFSAAGDDGSDDCDTVGASPQPAGTPPLGVDDPASQPYVVSVGGTSIDAAGQPPLEQVWNDGPHGGGGGGGISASWTMPAWQQTATVPGLDRPGSADYTNANALEQRYGFAPGFCDAGTGATTPCRLTPDVSSQADEFTGAITVYQAAFGGWGPTGGTSSATPIWAAMLADVNASATCTAQPATRSGVGFASPLLYAVASNPSQYAASFNDVTLGDNDVYGLDGGLTFPTRHGYDLASGLGSPRLTGPGGTAGLAYYLCGLAGESTRPVVSYLTPAYGSTAGGETVTINGSGFERGGAPDVARIQIGTAVLEPSAFTVTGPDTITATLPPARATLPPDAPAPQDGAGPAEVVVVLTGGAASAPGAGSTFEYADEAGGGAKPSITGIIPVAGAQSSPPAVTILGSGFEPGDGVTFGGSPAHSVTVESPYRITVTPPPYSSHPACAPLPSTGVYAGENASNDICQVEVQVTGAHGVSTTAPILPPYEGTITTDAMGDLVAPPGCGCETQPAVTEFDYIPAPAITSISTSGGPSDLASENGGTVITVHGTGFDPLTINWTDIGDPAVEASMDTSWVYVTGTEIQIVAPAEPLTVTPATYPFSVNTLAGQSAPVTITYAGVPVVSAVVNTANGTALHGIDGGPDTGMTPLAISGQGFAGQLIAPIEFTDTGSGGSFGTQYVFTVAGDTTVDTRTVAQNAALVDVRLCTVTACSATGPGDEFYLYPPGTPNVTSVTPASGPAAGGTHVSVGGHNLSCALAVYFGNTPAPSFSPVPDGLDCGSSTVLRAVSPAGPAGTTVPVTVQTLESYFTGSGRGTTSASFTYR